MEHKGTVRLETPRLILRRYVIDDFEPMYRNCWSEYDVWKWTNYVPMDCLNDVKTKANMFTEKWLSYDNPRRYSWAMELKSTGDVIGRMFGMRPDDELGQVELAYEMGKPWWNRGLMTEAVRVTLDFLLRDVGLRQVYAYHADANPASGKVMQKCGMVYQQTIPQGCRCNAGVFDRVEYLLTAEEYFRQKKNAQLR